MIETRGWLSPLVTNKLRTLCPIEVPLGIYLQQVKLLTPEQINLIFQIQLHQIYQLFELTSGLFKFDEMSELQDRIMTIPWLEMTGKRLKATEVSIYALRLIKEWDIFADRLPAPNLIFKRLIAQCPLKLMSLEWKIWQRIDGLNSINTIATQLNQPVQSVQIAAFRLLAAGLIEEIILPGLTLEESEQSAVSNKVKPLEVQTITFNQEAIKPAEQNEHEENLSQKTNPDVTKEKTSSNPDFSPPQFPEEENQGETTQNDSNPSLLSNLIDLLRNQP